LPIEGLQANAICVLEVAVAIKLVGAVGGLWAGSDGAVEFGVFTDALHP
jgi:hypothetical protein